jgi:hypothetical protein
VNPNEKPTESLEEENLRLWLRLEKLLAIVRELPRCRVCRNYATGEDPDRVSYCGRCATETHTKVTTYPWAFALLDFAHQNRK